MKRFVFSMQKVLDLREFEKKQAEAELSKAIAEENRIEETLKMVASQKAQTISASNEMKDISGLYGANQFMRLLEQRKETLLQELTEAQMITEQKREVMREAMQKVKVLEKLKENRLKDWKKESLREEENVIDEIVTSKGNNQ